MRKYSSEENERLAHIEVLLEKILARLPEPGVPEPETPPETKTLGAKRSKKA
jgi:hypothetical protein